MFIFFFLLIGVPALLVTCWCVFHVLPLSNRLFGLIWEDPSERQRNAAAARLKDLHVDGEIPSETAVLLTSKEMNTDEQEILELMKIGAASEVKNALTGNQGFLGRIASELERTFKIGTTRKR